MTDIIIRPAKEKDMAVLHQLIMELAHFEKVPDEVVTHADGLKKDLKTHWFDALVAVKDKSIVGMVLYYKAYSTWKGRMIYLEDFFVLPSERGQGIGQKLFDALCTLAKKESCKLVKWQVLNWNEDAIRFYQRNQAELTDEWLNGRVWV